MDRSSRQESGFRAGLRGARIRGSEPITDAAGAWLMTDECCSPRHHAPMVAAIAAPTRTGPRRSRTDLPGMMQIPGGAFRMGGADPQAYPHDGEGPVRTVT